MSKYAKLKRVFTTGTLKQMAVAKYTGAITWAQEIFVSEEQGIQRGILLFDSQAAAAAYQKSRGGYPFVVCEFPVEAIDKDYLVRCEEVGSHTYDQPFRQWWYSEAIIFDRAWWHTYKQVAEDITEKINERDWAKRDQITGVVSIDTSGNIIGPVTRAKVNQTKKDSKPKQSTVVVSK